MITRFKDVMRRFAADESGQGLVEYVLIIALVAVGLILALTVFRNQIGNTLDEVNNSLQNAPSTPYSPGS
jgi:pilus assembly protein Flp/PilA